MTAKRTELSRHLRRAPTDAEALLWHHLRGRHISGYKFRRQHSVGPYVLDFFCHEARLAIEVDGSQHMENVEQDEAGTRYLEALGIRVVRYTNIEVLTETDSVLEAIFNEIRGAPSPQPSPPGRGDSLGEISGLFRRPGAPHPSLSLQGEGTRKRLRKEPLLRLG